MTVIFDLEVLPYFFSYTALDVKTEKVWQFVSSPELNQIPELVKHLKQVKGMVGYNNLGYDSFIIDLILRNPLATYKDTHLTSICLIKKYDNEERVVNWKPLIQQLDLYALHGFNKNAKRTSLKWCEFGMGFENVEDVDFNELLNPLSSEQERKVLIYNINDVLATHELYKRSEDLIKIRKELSKTYNINLMNADEPKLTTELFLELLHRESGINKNIIKEGRSPKEKILLKDVILPYIKFETYALKETLKMFKSKVIPGNSLKGVLEYNTNVFDIQVYYGLGGIHACTESGVYRSTDDKIIIDCDVK